MEIAYSRSGDCSFEVHGKSARSIDRPEGGLEVTVNERPTGSPVKFAAELYMRSYAGTYDTRLVLETDETSSVLKVTCVEGLPDRYHNSHRVNSIVGQFLSRVRSPQEFFTQARMVVGRCNQPGLAKVLAAIERRARKLGKLGPDYVGFTQPRVQAAVSTYY